VSKLIIIRGLPAAGKTTCATQWVAEDRRCRVRVNRDDLRAMIDGGVHVEGVTEERIINAEFTLIQAFLCDGLDVICDDTNLPERTVDQLRDEAKDEGASFEIIDMRDVPLETCIERNAARERQVPEKVIRDMHFKYIEGRLPGD
jgi:tRNA uridine 5-carbamoylmethylation protein Kti12